jgi:hypothetical protein
LISLVVSERACNARLRQLKQGQADAERVLAELVGVHTEHAAVVQKERAEIETARAAVEKWELAIFVREEEITAAEEHRQTRAEIDRLRGRFQTGGPGGLVREFVPGYPRGGENSPRRRTKGGQPNLGQHLAGWPPRPVRTPKNNRIQKKRGFVARSDSRERAKKSKVLFALTPRCV